MIITEKPQGFRIPRRLLTLSYLSLRQNYSTILWLLANSQVNYRKHRMMTVLDLTRFLALEEADEKSWASIYSREQLPTSGLFSAVFQALCQEDTANLYHGWALQIHLALPVICLPQLFRSSLSPTSNTPA